MIRQSIDPKKIYVSHLREKLVENAEGWKKLLPVDKSFPPTGNELLDQCAAFLATDFKCRAKDLANHLDIKMERLEGLFQFVLDTPLKEFLQKYRTLVCLEMLRCTGLKLKEIAQLCGTNRHQVLLDVKKETGMSPMGYRKERRPKDYKERYRW